MSVGGVYEHLRAVAAGQEVVQLSLCPDHSFERPEALQMGFPDVGYQSVVGLDGLNERLDVARMARAHLYHGYLVLLSQAQESLGHTDVVIEVALGIQHFVLLRQHGSHEFLGCCLSVCARYAYHGYVELPAVVACQLLESGERVVRDDVSLVARILRFVYHCVGAALLKGGFGKPVSVERLSLQGEEDGAFGTVAAVGRYSLMFRE